MLKYKDRPITYATKTKTAAAIADLDRRFGAALVLRVSTSGVSLLPLSHIADRRATTSERVNGPARLRYHDHETMHRAVAPRCGAGRVSLCVDRMPGRRCYRRGH